MATDLCEGSLNDGLDFYGDAARLPKRWHSLAVALMEYAQHISRSRPNWETEQWVFRPENFVTFRIQFKRKTGLTLYLRGTLDEYPALHGRKTVVNSVPGYSKIILDSFDQVPEAFLAVDRAYELFKRGRSRRKKELNVVEQARN